ncbi:DUF3857 and transglutaminase domain-containing protein [Methylomonas sp. AM2-LC]|uniref:DUF3857 domain-containing transglutaminase family protein n=1 Tax=Methylomonas sp. AM2-LC TaxID=3153301 RepID=UPI003267B6DA
MSVFSVLTYALLLLSLSAQAANKLPDNMKSRVRWTPLKTAQNFHELLAQPEKIAEFEKLGYGTVTLLEKHAITLSNNHEVAETVTDTQLYLNPNGIENAGNKGFWLDVDNQQVEIQQAYVLQPDGAQIHVDPGTLQINNDRSTNIFSDHAYVTIPFPQLKQGSISVLVYKTITHDDKLPLPWSRLLYPAKFEQIERFQVDVNWADAKLKPNWQTDYAKLECQENAYSLHCSTMEASPPIPTDKDMPSPYDILPVLALAEPSHWKDISNNMQKMIEPALSNTQKIKELAVQLGKDAVNPEEKLSRISNFVSRDIRYVGLEHGHGGTIPRPSLTTLERRYGDCKDKTLLFVDLARQIGLDAYPVLTSTKRQSLSKLLLPSANYFNHMIACVRLNPDKESCVDLTDPDTSAEYLPQSLQGAISLTIGREDMAPGNLALEPYTWIERIKADNRFTRAGDISESLERRYHSHWAASLRSKLTSKSQVERDRWLLEDYRAVMSEKATPVVQVEGLDRLNNQLVISSTTQFHNAIDNEQFTNYSEHDPWLKELAIDSKTTNIHYPYSFKGIDYQSQMNYTLDQGNFVNNIGPKLDYVTPWGVFRRYYRKDETGITAYTELKMPRAIIPIDKIQEFNSFLELSAQETRIWFDTQQTKNK